MTSEPLVAVIILNWNNAGDTIACVESCRELTWTGARILVVDNGSGDGSQELLARECSGVEIIQTGANLGFAGGNNVGIRRALELGASYIWLLNNDAVAEPRALSRLVEALEEDPAAAIAGSLIRYHHDPQRIWFAGGSWQKGRLRLRQAGAYRLDRGQFPATCAIGAASGCSMLVRSDALARLGLMDEDYFLYWEDTDWCARAGALGYRVLLVPASLVWHKVSATVRPLSEIQYYYHARNGLRFCRRHDLLSLPLFLCYVTVDACQLRLRGNRSAWAGFLRGVADFLRGKGGRCPAPSESAGAGDCA